MYMVPTQEEIPEEGRLKNLEAGWPNDFSIYCSLQAIKSNTNVSNSSNFDITLFGSFYFY